MVNEGRRIETVIEEVLSLDWVFEESELLPGLAPLVEGLVFSHSSLETVGRVVVVIADSSPQWNFTEAAVDHIRNLDHVVDCNTLLH